jgi:hypothetical protein
MMRYYHRQIKLKCLTRTKGFSISGIIDFQRRASTCAQENYPAPFSHAMDGNSHATAIKVGKGLIIGVNLTIDQSGRMCAPAGFAGCDHEIAGHHAAIPVLGDILMAWIIGILGEFPIATNMAFQWFWLLERCEVSFHY